MSGVVVTQADREAAARLAHETGETWMRSERIRRGECEGFSEDFARHRHQSTAPLIAAMEAAAGIIRRYRDETPPGHSPHMICHEADEVMEQLTAHIEAARKGE